MGIFVLFINLGGGQAMKSVIFPLENSSTVSLLLGRERNRRGISACIIILQIRQTMRRRFEWLCASIQFAFVVVFAHIFYYVPVLSILLATFVGCGVAMCGSSIVVEILRLERRRQHDSDT
ncbi:hypothetical protein HanHA300_Chr01g0020271 [Helianthus annuus]|nr:hypothetical protein HanHA300_Chr01g0020271 [Helianthus annuus]